MQNVSRKYLAKTNGIRLSRDARSDNFVTYPYTQYEDYVWTANRSGKRKRPAVYLPRNGTNSYMTRTVHACTSLGDPPGKYDLNTAWSQWKPGNYENQDVAVTRGEQLLPYSEGSKAIQNKIIAEIVSGKAQAAVDLVELRKTKDMVTNAGLGLFRLYKDVRSGRAISSFIREMNRDGFRSTLGNKWLEYIYGWAPTISGAFETAEILQKSFAAGMIYTGRVRHNMRRSAITYQSKHHREISTTNLRCRGFYEFTISDPKMLTWTQLGFTNPLSIAWELLPWSFVLDWFVDIGGYINRMDFALGMKDIYWQYSAHRKVYQTVRYSGYLGNIHNPACEAINVSIGHQRLAPSQVLINSFKGIKPFTNETVRLTSAVALINQQLSSIKKIR